jgi:hypothetical protein
MEQPSVHLVAPNPPPLPPNATINADASPAEDEAPAEARADD